MLRTLVDAIIVLSALFNVCVLAHVCVCVRACVCACSRMGADVIIINRYHYFLPLESLNVIRQTYTSLLLAVDKYSLFTEYN